MEDERVFVVKSLKNNVILNTIKNVVSVVVPLASFMYVSRIIGPEGIGKVTFAQSFINYFLVFALIGIPVYGVREISKVRSDKKLLNERFSEIFFINVVFTLISFLALAATFYLFHEIGNNKLMVWYSLNLFFLLFSVEWLYQGLEDYTFITIRSILVELISFLLILLFVKSSDDYFVFAVILISMKGVYSIVNFYRATKLIEINLFQINHLSKHLRPLLFISGICIVDNVYQNLDAVMLGFQFGNKEVGFYTSVFQMIRIATFLIISLSIVLIPRLSYYIENGLMIDFQYTLSKSIDILMLISIPAMFGMFSLSGQLILCFAGNEFLPSILTLKIMAPLIFINSLYIVIGYNVLVPLGKEKSVFICLSGGVILNIVFNIILIGEYAHNGAAFAALITHFGILVMLSIVAKKIVLPLIFKKAHLQYVFSTAIMVLIIEIIKFICVENVLLQLLLSIFVSLVVYGTSLVLLKNEITEEILKKFIKTP